jgi:hypothetical protein
MRKVTIIADTVLSVVQKVFNDNEIDAITDPKFPKPWQGKSIQKVLNIVYYTFKHRPESTEQIIAQKKKDGVAVSELEALNRAFGCLTLSTVERIFSTNNDIATIDATLDFWVQSSKVKLLEYLIEKTTIALSGVVLPLDFTMEDGTTERRNANIVFGRLGAPEFDTESQIGEAVRCSLPVQMTIQPPTTMMSNYKFEFATEMPKVGAETWDTVMNEIPVMSFQFASTMNQRGVPMANRPQRTGVVNLGLGGTMSFTFDGINGVNFINWLTERLLLTNSIEPRPPVDNNLPIYVRITRGALVAIHAMVITQHSITVNDDGTNEVHSLTLAWRGA